LPLYLHYLLVGLLYVLPAEPVTCLAERLVPSQLVARFGPALHLWSLRGWQRSVHVLGECLDGNQSGMLDK